MSQMLIPNTVTEACQMLSSGNRVACAGATNLYVDREKGKYLDRDIVSLHRLKELSGIREEKDGWHIGSLTTFDLIEDAFRGQGSMDALAEAASLVGGPQIRNRGTIGGNILSASPAADTVPVLMALMIKQMKEANKKKEEKIKELQEFIQRFSANASKSKQATSRKRALEKIQLDEIRPSSRKYPYIDFKPNREIGNEVLHVEGISKTIDGVKLLDNISFTLGHDDKVAFVGPNVNATTALFKILAGEMEPDEGSYKWGVTTTQTYFPKDNTAEFTSEDSIVDWLMQYSPEKDVTFVRGFLGRMLFSGDDGLKKVNVLSGGERVRCMLSKMMMSGANTMLMDEPTNHLDMESITALNNSLIKYPGVLLFTSQDHQFVQTVANRIMELTPGGLIDKQCTYDEYLENDEMARKRQILNMEAEADD